MAYYNDYGVQFQGEFDSIPRNNGQVDTFSFYIRKKNTPANISSVLCGKSPIIQEWMADDPITSVKGSQLEVTLINIDNALPLSTFYSESDDDWKIEVFSYHNTGTSIETKTLFVGYLVQEDCTEEFSDIGHEIKLSFTDNLGLLKDISFTDGLKIVPKTSSDLRSIFGTAWKYYDTIKLTHCFFVLYNVNGLGLSVGDTMILEGTPYADGIYTINFIEFLPSPTYYAYIYVNEKIPDLDFGTPDFNMYFITPHTEKILSLNDIIKVCLLNTGFALYTYEANTLKEVSQVQPVNGNRVFDYVYINTDTFIETSSSRNCYDILEKILYRFSAELYQAEGSWRIIRWHELRNQYNVLDANKYNEYFEYVDRVETTKLLSVGDGTDIEYGITTGIERPFKYIKHTYNYSQNENLPFNGNLQILGNLLRTYTENGNTIKEYEAYGWTDVFPPSSGWVYVTRYIRVVYDSLGAEIDRYLVIDKTNGISDDRRSVCSNFPIDLMQNDKIKISFEWRTRSPHNGNGTSLAAMPGLTKYPNSIYDPSGNNAWYYINQDGSWEDAMGSLGTYFDNNWDEWQTVEAESKYIPFDGKAFIMLPTIYHPNENFTYIRNINIEYFTYFNGSKSVIGQYHKTQIPFVIKNVENEEIFMDDTIKNYSKGTLFLYNDEGGIRKKTSLWNDGVALTPNVKLGEVITRQFQLWKDQQRIKLEGKIWSVINADGDVLSPNMVLQLGQIAQAYFKFGKLSLDYRENNAEFTLYEMWKLSEDGNLSLDDRYGIMKNREISYEFNYIFK